MLKMPLYPVSTLAKLFQITERRIQQLAEQGIIPKADRDQYDLIGAVRGYITYLSEKARRQSTTPTSEWTDHEKRRLLKAQADRAEYENALWRKQWIKVSEAGQVIQEMADLLAACIDAIPGRLALDLTGIQDPAVVKNKLFDACRQIRANTADRFRAFVKDMLQRQEIP